MVDAKWRAQHPWAELLRKFAKKLRDEGRDINDGFYALLTHSADELDVRASKLDAAEKERDRAVARAARIAELDPDWERADDDMQGALREIEDLTVKNINLQNELAEAADVELMRFYTVESVPALVKALSHHVEKLQDKLQRCYGPQERIRTAVREG